MLYLFRSAKNILLCNYENERGKLFEKKIGKYLVVQVIYVPRFYKLNLNTGSFHMLFLCYYCHYYYKCEFVFYNQINFVYNSKHKLQNKLDIITYIK